MSAKELFDAGNLSGAIDQLTQDVKASPRELRSRIFLFELLCFAGDYQRAERQLDAIVQVSGDAQVEMGVQIYRHSLEAEKTRHAVFAGTNRLPKFLSEPPGYTALHLEAVSKIANHRLNEVEGRLDECVRIRTALKGEVDGTYFADFRDCDDLMAPFMEAFVNGDYVWLPFEQIRRIDIQPPRTLRDLLWIPAKIELRTQALGEVLLPVLYQGSAENPDDLVKLGRMTNWTAVGETVTLGSGQRMFLIDDTERPMLEIKKIEFAESA